MKTVRIPADPQMPARPSRLARVLVTGAVLALVSNAAFATWRAHQEGNNWVIREGNNRVAMPDKKTAEKTANKLNKAQKKGEKRQGSGFMAEEDGPCAKPMPNMNC
ncbi:MAG: hypothetical protein R3E87_20725 [Burkholderiaceae bacterium]